MRGWKERGEREGEEFNGKEEKMRGSKSYNIGFKKWWYGQLRGIGQRLRQIF